MTPDRFTTRPLRPQDQLEAWREWYGPVFEVTPRDALGGGFAGETRLWKLGGLLMSRTSAAPARVLRNKDHLRRDPADHWVISFCVRGAHLTKTGDVEVEVPAGVPFLWSLRQELLYERTRVDRVQIFLARDAFRDAGPLLDAACGAALDTPLGGLLGDYLIALERRLPDVAEADFAGIAEGLGAMVAAAAAPSAERLAVARPQIDLGRRERVRQAVRRHLRTPTLEPNVLARLVGMSRSNLYRLFENLGGVARYIQRERLREARRLLTDPANPKSIAVIAEEFCFADASGFTRSFRREFGHSPGELRSAALAGLALPATRRSPSPSAGTDLAELLRGF